MNKLMKKKVNVFGKEFSVFIIAIISMMVFATAALVPYISNVVTGTVSVSAPLTLNISKNNLSWGNSVGLGAVHGFDTIGFYYKLENNGNKTIDANATINISNSIGNATCEDFSNMTVTIEGTTSPNLLSLCKNNAANRTAFVTQNFTGLSGREIGYATFNATFEGNVEPAKYTFTGYVPAEGSSAS